MGEPRGNTGGDGRDRFHAGLDVRAVEGTIVRANRRGKVETPMAAQGFDLLNESVAISPFTYVHLRVGRDHHNRLLDAEPFVPVFNAAGQMVRVRLRRGARIELSDPLGTVNRFSHVHLNAGGIGREINPLLLRLPGFRDTVPPSIAARGIQLIDEHGELLSTRVRGRLVVSGRVRIVVDAWDRADGNTPRRRLGVFRLGYQVLDEKGNPAAGFGAPRVTMVFDRLPQAPEAARLVYAEGSGITAYGNRRTRYLYVLTNQVRDGVAAEGFWDTNALPPGDYTLRVLVEDAAGNAARKGRDLPITMRHPQSSPFGREQERPVSEGADGGWGTGRARPSAARRECPEHWRVAGRGVPARSGRTVSTRGADSRRSALCRDRRLPRTR
jgi:hypothetical protein